MKDRPNTNTSGFIVAFGFAEGGLESLKTLFSHMREIRPETTVVLIPSAGVRFAVRLSNLVRRYTRIPVIEVDVNTDVTPGRIYVLAPGVDLYLSGGLFRTLESEPDSVYAKPFDYFLESVAPELEDRATAVLLSGSGTDGLMGLRALGAAGGLRIVQEPGATKVAQLPAAAVARDLADLVLPPEEIPVSIDAHIELLQARSVPFIEVREMPPAAASALSARAGFDPAAVTPAAFSGCVQKRMRFHRLEEAGEFWSLLEKSTEEAVIFAGGLLRGAAGGFFNPEFFRRSLESVVYTRAEEAVAGSSFRVWTAGFSSLEEIRGIAEIVESAAGQGKNEIDISFWATDPVAPGIDPTAGGPQEKNAAGCPRHEEKPPPGAGTPMKIHRCRRALFDPPPADNLDLIICRYRLSQFSPDARIQLLSLFHTALNPRGFLLLGLSETADDAGRFFDLTDTRWKILRRRSLQNGGTSGEESSGTSGEESSGAPGEENGGTSGEESSGAPGEENGGAPGEESSGAPGEESSGAPGEETGGTSGEETSGTSGEEGKTVSPPPGPAAEVPHTNGIPSSDSTPAAGSEGIPPKPSKSFEKPLRNHRPVRCGAGETPAMKDLRKQLEEITEALETTRTELKTRDALLKQAGAQLVTVRESLQCFTDSLIAANQEARRLIEAAAAECRALRGMPGHLEAPILLLDSHLCILGFSPAFTRYYPLQPTDVGRPLEHFASTVEDLNLPREAATVCRYGVPASRTVVTPDQRSETLHFRPVWEEKGGITGVLVLFSETETPLNPPESV